MLQRDRSWSFIFISVKQKGRAALSALPSSRDYSRVQYAANDYVDILLEHGFQISMARKGNTYDNATAESFMKTLKQKRST
jgi:transposase InsO family protein